MKALIAGGLLPLLMIGSAAVADISLQGQRAYPENVVADDKGSLYVSNMAEGGVVRIIDGQATAWIKAGAFGTGATFGMLPQPDAGIFWVCSNDLSAMKLAKSADGRNALVGFDLATGAGRVSIGLPDLADCNDLALGKDGSIYLTDGRSSRIFRLPPGGRALKLFSDDPLLQDKGYGVDGIAIDERGDIYVNTFPSGRLFRIEVLKGRADRPTALVLDRPLGTADGLRHEGGNHFLVVSTSGLERLTVTGNSVSVKNLRTGLTGPSGVAIFGDRAFVAEGQALSLFSGQEPTLPFQLRIVPIPPR